MIDLRTLWGGIYENLHGFDDIQLEQIKQAVFYEIGKYDFQPKPEHTELVVYDDDKTSYRTEIRARAEAPERSRTDSTQTAEHSERRKPIKKGLIECLTMKKTAIIKQLWSRK